MVAGMKEWPIGAGLFELPTWGPSLAGATDLSEMTGLVVAPALFESGMAEGSQVAACFLLH